MISANRQIMILLLALTLGVWGLLVRSLFPPTTGSASQPSTAKLVYIASVSRDPVTRNEKIFFNNPPGRIVFDGTEMIEALAEAARRGIRVHSVVLIPAIGDSLFAHHRFLVFVEK